MNTENLSALAVGIGVVALIAGFAIYFNSPALNKSSSAGASGTNYVPAVIVQNSTSKPVAAGNQTANSPAVPVNSSAPKSNATATRPLVLIDKSQFRKAPELAGITGYINSGNNLTLSSLRGKVVLVDFWTYSCINCIRTIPYLNAWYDKYHNDGLVIVGVHSPEFDFEKDYNNVHAAVDKFGIKYPVVLDSNHATWNAFNNNYWPRHYLIDTEGYIRSDHIGEGGYSETEQQIQSLLTERAALMDSNVQIDKSISNPNATSVNFEQVSTPEIYLGYGFAREPLGNPQGFQGGQTVTYSLPASGEILPNSVYLAGQWKNNNDNMQLANGTGKIVLTYTAKAVNIVAGGTGKVVVMQDGKPVDSHSRGSDVSAADNSFGIDRQRLYNVVTNDSYGTHTVELDISGAGFQIYTFTFG
ncbi:MAG: thioredoxin family protein [Nitrososphaera sp.]